MTPITPELLSAWRVTQSDNTIAGTLDHRARMIDTNISDLFAEVGVIVKEVDDRDLWRYITKTDGDLCHSFDDWVLNALPVSRSTAYAARKVAQRLPHLSMQERSDIGPGNLRTLAEVDDPGITQSRPILDAAKTMKRKPREFREMIIRDFPGQHIEREDPIKFTPSVSQRRPIEEALVLAVALGDAGNRNEALECIAVHYLQTRPREEEVEETVIPARVQ